MARNTQQAQHLLITCPHVAVAPTRFSCAESVPEGGTARQSLPDSGEHSEGTNCWADVSLREDVSQVAGRSEDTCAQLSVFLPVTPLHLATFFFLLSLFLFSTPQSSLPTFTSTSTTPSSPSSSCRASRFDSSPLITETPFLRLSARVFASLRNKKKGGRAETSSQCCRIEQGEWARVSLSHTHTQMCFGMVIRWQSGGRYIPDPCLLLIRLLHSK